MTRKTLRIVKRPTAFAAIVFGVIASTTPCRAQEQCPPGSLFGQSPSTPGGGWTASMSDSSESVCWYDNYAVSGDIVTIRWWGLMVYQDPQQGWIDCTESPTIFRLSFHADANGQPGAQVDVRDVTVYPENTGLLYGWPGYTLHRFEADLPSGYPVTLHSGWIGIQGTLVSTPECWFLWMDSPDGDGVCWFEEDGVGQLMDRDYSFCLLPEHVPGDINGDGAVDVSDLLLLLSDWGCTGPDCPGDINGDGQTDVSDLLLLLSNWS